jgi:hypothetical protein
LDGQEIFPSTFHQAYNVLHRRSMGATYNQLEGGGVAFAQAALDGRSKSHITCFQCGQRGHYANECTTRNEQQVQGSNSLVVGVEYHLFSQAASNIPATWILLDNQSTLDLFSNRNLLNSVNMFRHMRRMTTQWPHGMLELWLSDQQGTLKAATTSLV